MANQSFYLILVFTHTEVTILICHLTSALESLMLKLHVFLQEIFRYWSSTGSLYFTGLEQPCCFCTLGLQDVVSKVEGTRPHTRDMYVLVTNSSVILSSIVVFMSTW